MLQEETAFHGSSGAKGPARATLTLILDRSDSAFGPPVNACLQSCDILGLNDMLTPLPLSWLQPKHLLELKFCPVSHIVLSLDVLVLSFSIVLADHGHVGFIECFPEVILFRSGIRFAVSGDIGHVIGVVG